MDSSELDPVKPKKFNWLLFVAVPVIIVLIAVAGFFLLRNRDTNENSSTVSQANQTVKTDEKSADAERLSSGKCKGTDKPKLGTLPMKYEDFAMILPYGLTVGGHVTPIDHQYFSPTVFNSPRDTYPVYAMADATIVDIQPRTNERGTEYRFVFSVSCKLFYYYDLVTSLSPDIKAEFDKKQRDINIPVKAGQEIGRIGGQTLDFAVWDMDLNLSGFVVPEHYRGEGWKIHTADPLDFYTDDLKQKALSKYAREVEPRSGKIDYDIDGKLIGNWFKEGTGGYVQDGKWQDYWKGHLSIAPNAYDPASIVVSIGDFAGEAKQFGVKGNTPDPKEVDTSTGMIKYELVKQDIVDATGNRWDSMHIVKGLRVKNSEGVEGTVLVQMTEKRKVKFEVFPGKSASQVTGFTSNVSIFER